MPELQVDIELDMDEPPVMPPTPARVEGLPQLELDMPEEPAPLPVVEAQIELTPEQKACAYFKKAQSLLLQERASEAIRTLEQSLKLDGDSPKSYEAWLLLGRLRLANPAWSTRAIEALQSASRVNPRAAEPWGLMGELYHRKGFKANAQGCYKKALELDPSVQVPDDLILHGEDSQKAQPGGLLGRLKSMLGREKE
jgi:tetratricopeptide (TPR) repeat protein